MKTFLILGTLILSSIAQAASIDKTCYAKAETAARDSAEPDYYDEDGFNATDCKLASNRKAVICEVAAFKGDGAAADTYRVVLSADCKHVYRVEMTGEE